MKKYTAFEFDLTVKGRENLGEFEEIGKYHMRVDTAKNLLNKIVQILKVDIPEVEDKTEKIV